MKRIISIMVIAGLIIFGFLKLQTGKTQDGASTEIGGTPVSKDVTLFTREDGKTVLQFQPGQNFFKDGEFRRYDLRFKPDDSYRNAFKVENKATAYFNLVSDQPYRLEYAGKYVEFYMQGVTVKNAVPGANSLFFPDVLISVDREIMPLPDGIKESLILRDSRAPALFTYLVESNLTPVLQNNGTVLFQEGETPYFLSTVPSVFDASGASVPFQIALRTQNDSQLMDITLDVEGDSLDIRYPIVIDPEMYTWQEDTTEIHDNTITNSNTSLNYGRSPWPDVQFYGNYMYRTLLKFDSINAYIPPNSTIDSATLKLYAYGLTGSNYVRIYRITQNWVEGTGWGQAGYSNWSYAQSGVAWSSAGGAYYDSVYASTTSGSFPAWHVFDLTGLVAYWYAKGDTGNKGMLLRQQSESGGHHGPTYCSSNYCTDPSLRPILEVIYTSGTPTDYTTHIRYSSDFLNLQQAIDSTRSGDMLYIDRDYTLTSTVEIKRPNVTIVGTKSVIEPDTNGYPSPLLRIINNGEDSVLYNILVRDIRFINTNVDTIKGMGTALEIYGDTSVTDGEMYGVKLEDLYVYNFDKAIHVKNAHDILIENCMVKFSNNGLKTENTIQGGGTGDIKVHGGFFINNVFHIFHRAGSINLFNWTCGHRRDATKKTFGIYSDSPTSINAFCCHFELLDDAIKSDTDSTPSITAIANDFASIADTAICINTQINNMLAIGNHLGLTGTYSGKPWIYAPSVLEGMLIGGNDYSPYSTIDSTAGLVEYAAVDSPLGNVTAYRIPYLTGNQLPSADKFVKGTLIFISDSNKVNISDGTNWINLN